MSLKSYYRGIVARNKPGSPTADEARRDLIALLEARFSFGPLA